MSEQKDTNTGTKGEDTGVADKAIETLENEGGQIAEERDWQMEARAEGWRPREEWKGSLDKWIDAQEFVERGEKILPIVQAKNRKLEEEIAEIRRTTAQFVAFQQAQLAKERKEKEGLIVQLESRKAQAVTDGNGAAVVQIDRQIDAARQELREAPVQVNRDPIVVQWTADNAWYGSEPDATAYADAAGYLFRQTRPDAGPAEVMAHITRKVRERFPEVFGEVSRVPGRRPQSPEGTQTSASPDRKGGKKKITLADLPEDVRDIGRRFVKQKVLTEEQYVSDYLANGGSL